MTIMVMNDNYVCDTNDDDDDGDNADVDNNNYDDYN